MDACVKAFSCARPVIVVDGTHLKGKYKGVMFVAATKDGNEQIVPLAFGIGDKENDLSWTWFLRQLRKTFGCPPNLLIVSDQHKNIKNAMEVVYPGIPHGICAYHLQKNITGHGKHIVAIFQKAANSYRTQDLENHMKDILVASKTAHKKLVDADVTRWSRSYCSVRRYFFLTSNAAECLNGRLCWARILPICTLLECVRTIIGHWFTERRADALSRSDELTEWAVKKLDNSAFFGDTMSVEPISAMKFKVISDTNKNYVVDLEMKSCTCRRFDLDLIPYSHASAAIRLCLNYL